jgi:hypothetical protein
MRIFIRIFLFIVAILLTAETKAQASPRQLYLDLFAAIESVDLKARLGFDSGTWKSTVSDTEIKWIVSTATYAVTSLSYAQGLLQSGQITFDDPITAVLQRRVNGQTFCVVYQIKRLDYSLQGFIEPTSILNPQPGSPSCNGQAGRAELQRVASISDNLQEVFSGRMFRGMGKLGNTVQCADANCNKTKSDTGPINQVQLLGTSNRVKLFGGKIVNFPSGGSIQTDAGSGFTIGRLDYDVPGGTVDGQIKDATLNISEGQLKAGSTSLTFAGGGGIQGTGISFVKANGKVDISGGNLRVALGPGTVLNLFSHPLYTSQIILDRAQANFTDLRISFSGASREVGARSASLQKVQVVGANLMFSETNNIHVGPTTFDAVLGCDDNQPADDSCLGFSWSDNKPNLIGRVTGLNATLQGGTFAIGDGGTVDLDPGGTIKADVLYIDTRKPRNPMRGELGLFIANISGRSISIDKDVKINAASVHLKSTKLTFNDGDKYPSGDIDFDGTLNGVVNGTFGNVPLAAATISFLAQRAPNEPVAIANGTVRGNATMRDAGASANITVAMENVVYSAGFGSADVSLEVTSATYTVYSPENKKPGKNVDVDLKEINIPISLLESIQVTNQHVVIGAGNWKVPEITRNFRLGFSLRNEELLYVLAHKDLGISEPKCSMKVKYLADSYIITGQLRLNLGGGNKGLIIDNMNLDKGISLDPDLGSCDDVIDVVCGFAGNLVLGPIGAAAAAMICHRKINDFVGDLTQKFKDMTKKAVGDLRFKASF